MKKLQYLVLAMCCLSTIWACTDCSDKRPTKVDVRLCYYAEFLTISGNEVREEVDKVVGNVNIAMTWDSPLHSPAADTTSFDDKTLRFDARKFAEEFRNHQNGTERLVCMTTYEIFECQDSTNLVIVNGVTYPDIDASVVSVAAMPVSDTLVRDYTRLILHELARQYGIDTCPDKNCLMHSHKDAGWIKNCTKFCSCCREKLTKIGWHLED